MRDGTVTAIEKTGLPEKIRVCLGNGCFIAGTLVTTRSGFKPIEEIVIGDYVLSRNEETGETSYKKVTDTLVRSTQEICTIELETGKIKSTTGHLFMVKDKWWKSAVELVVEDVLVTAEGKEQVVKSIKVEEKGYPVTTYNLTVEDNHTFFVNNEGILTHNMAGFKTCEFLQVRKKLVNEYAEIVNSNKVWNWAEHISDGAELTAKQRKMIKDEAIEKGLIPNAKMKPGTKYPDFEAAGLIKKVDNIPKELWDATDVKQFNWLDKRIIGGRPAGTTWHHSEIEGRMELVPFGIHNIINHKGGRSLGNWASFGKR